MSEILTILEVAIMFLIGLVLIFDGYKVEQVLVTIIWFLLGYNLATHILGFFGLTNQIILIVVGVIVGLCVGAVGWKLDNYAFFVAVGYAAYMILPSYITIQSNILFFIVRLVLAIIVALIALRFKHVIFVIVASLIGATLMKRAVLILFPTLPYALINLTNVIVVILVAIGLLSQLEEYQKSL